MTRTQPAARDALRSLVAEGFLSRLSFGVVSFVLPLYAYQLGMELTEIGFLLGFNLVVAMVLKVPMGWVADRIGCRPVLITAIVARSVVTLLLVFAVAPWHLFAIRGLHGVSIGLRDPAVSSLIAVHGGKDRVASSFAWYQTGKSVAGSLGKGAGGLLLGLSGASYPFAFLVAFALSVLPLWVVVRSVRDGAALPPAASRTAGSPAAPATVSSTDQAADPVARAPAGRPPTLAAATFGLLVTGTAYMMANLFPILAVEHAGLTEEQTGLVFVLAALVTLAGPGFGWLSDRVSHRLVLSVRSLANVASSVMYLVAPSFAGYAGAKLTDDLGKAAFKPAWGALMARVAALDPRRRARTMSIVSLGEDAGEVAGPVVAGLLWSTWGLGALFGVRIALAIGTEVYAIGLERRLGPGAPAPAPGPPPGPGPGRLVLDGVRFHPTGGVRDATVEPTSLLEVGDEEADAAVAVLTGVRAPVAGRVRLDGHDLAAPSATTPLVGVLTPGDLPLAGTVAQVMARAGAPAEARARAWALSGALEALGALSDAGPTAVHDLGQAQRWFLAAAAGLVHDPALVVAVRQAGAGPLPAPLLAALRRYPGAAVVVGADPQARWSSRKSATSV